MEGGGLVSFELKSEALIKEETDDETGLKG